MGIYLMTGMSVKRLKHIAVSERNYEKLKTLGYAGESFNDVITAVLKKLGKQRPLQSEPRIEPRDQTATMIEIQGVDYNEG